MVCEAVCERDKLLRKEFEYFLISSAYVSKIPDKIPFSMLFFLKDYLYICNMKTFNVITYDFNSGKFVEYDIMPYLIRTYNEKKEKKETLPETFDEFKNFVKSESKYQFWARCEYEIILIDWPCQKNHEKWDIYKQIMMNLDIVTKVFMENIKE